MEVKIEGDPGTGNIFQEIHIGTVENYNPNATTVNNTYYINNVYGDGKKGKDVAQNQMPETDKVHRMAEIMQYVSKLKCLVAQEYKTVYEKLWHRILEITEVSAVVCEPGKQQNTTFNRKLVANIMHVMIENNVFKDRNVTTIATTLETDKDHPVRGYLGMNPEDKVIAQKVKDTVLKALYG